MQPLRPLMAALWMLAAAPLAAQDDPVVVELFTSQGCSSCPPADAILLQLTRRDDVLPLALHVDYWDYIGWKDLFADPGHGKRQRGYARAGGRDMVYTPQMIVNGREDVVGAHAMELVDLIARHRAEPPVAIVTLSGGSGDVTIRVAPVAGPLAGPFDIHLVRYAPLRHASIKRGENAGRDLEYGNVVESWRVVGQWDGRQAAEFPVHLDGDRKTAVLLQHRNFGPIVAAARSR